MRKKEQNATFLGSGDRKITEIAETFNLFKDCMYCWRFYRFPDLHVIVPPLYPQQRNHDHDLWDLCYIHGIPAS